MRKATPPREVLHDMMGMDEGKKKPQQKTLFFSRMIPSHYEQLSYGFANFNWLFFVNRFIFILFFLLLFSKKKKKAL
jgi:hypothetical protein